MPSKLSAEIINIAKELKKANKLYSIDAVVRNWKENSESYQKLKLQNTNNPSLKNSETNEEILKKLDELRKEIKIVLDVIYSKIEIIEKRIIKTKI